MLSNYIYIFTDLYFFTSFFILFFIGIFFNLKKQYYFSNIYKLCCFFILISIINIIIIDTQYQVNYSNTYDIIKNDADLLIKWFLLVFVSIFLCYSYKYIKKNKLHLFEYVLVIYFTIFSFSLFISTIDLLSFYLLLEIQSLCFYMLTAFNKNNQYSVESGLKYFVLSSFSSVCLLYGFSFIYGITGSLNYYDIFLFFSYNNIHNSFNYTYYIACFFILVAFLFKLYIAPFHIWVGDIYQGSPSMTTAFFASITSFPLFYIFIKYWSTLFYWLQPIFLYIICILSILSMLLGLFGALYQKKIKRLVAFSSVSNIGYLLIAFIQENIQSYIYSIVYFIMYMINITGLFAIFLNLYILKKMYFIERLTLLSGLFLKNKILAFSIVVLFFTSAGVPPFPLFLTKILILMGLSYNIFSLLLFILVFSAILSSYYYIRVIKNISFNINTYWVMFGNINYISALIIINIVLINFFYFFSGSLLLVISDYIILSII
jgi:NADH-quinone oxidoreductase subunit N